MKKILFVCMGNICRSPTARGCFEAHVARLGLGDQLSSDSAGTHAYHVGEQPDPRSMDHAARQGIDLSGDRARQVTVKDFHRFDYILAMDDGNLARLRQLQPEDGKAQLARLLELAPVDGRLDVPDPYYGGAGGFDDVLGLVDQSTLKLVELLSKPSV